MGYMIDDDYRELEHKIKDLEERLKSYEKYRAWFLISSLIVIGLVYYSSLLSEDLSTANSKIEAMQEHVNYFEEAGITYDNIEDYINEYVDLEETSGFDSRISELERNYYNLSDYYVLIEDFQDYLSDCIEDYLYEN